MTRRIPPYQAVILGLVLEVLHEQGLPIHSVVISASGEIEVRLGQQAENPSGDALERWRDTRRKRSR